MAVKIPANKLKELPVLKPDDIIDINEIAVKQKFDFIAVPGIVSAKDLQWVRQQIKGTQHLAILAKIDNLEAI